MLSKRVEEALNDQLQVELESAYVYLGMAAHCEAESLTGFAAWLHRQAEEEYAHAMRFYKFINDRDGRVALRTLDGPPTTYKSILAIFEAALDHERKVTAAIDKLYTLVAEEKDYASQAWLDWFATEQVEEEAAVQHIVDQLGLINGAGEGLLLLDRELAQRTTTR